MERLALRAGWRYADAVRTVETNHGNVASLRELVLGRSGVRWIGTSAGHRWEPAAGAQGIARTWKRRCRRHSARRARGTTARADAETGRLSTTEGAQRKRVRLPGRIVTLRAGLLPGR